MKAIVIVVLCCFAALCQAAVNKNYCRPDLCKGKRHVACQFSEPSRICLAGGAIPVDMKNFTSAILKYHNMLRNNVASGMYYIRDHERVQSFRGTAFMTTMEWDEDLAELARFNVHQCVMNHDECRRTDAYKAPGQNLAGWWYSEPYNVTEKIIVDLLKGWNKEALDCKQEYITAYPSNKTITEKIGHFTPMVNSKNNRVGCAATYYYDWNVPRSPHAVLLACNYALNNMKKWSTYDPAARRCSTGYHRLYRYLCSPEEKVVYIPPGVTIL